MKLNRIVASVAAGAVLSLGLAVPAQAVPPAPYCYGGPGPTWDITYKGVRVHLAVYCQWLDTGRSWYFGHARLTLQNGNLIIYDQSNRVRWSSRTPGSGAT